MKSIILMKIRLLCTKKDSKKRVALQKEIETLNRKREKDRDNRPENDTFRHDASIYFGVSIRNCDEGITHPIEVRLSTNGIIHSIKTISSGIKDIIVGGAGLISNIKATKVEEVDVTETVTVNK